MEKFADIFRNDRESLIELMAQKSSDSWIVPGHIFAIVCKTGNGSIRFNDGSSIAYKQNDVALIHEKDFIFENMSPDFMTITMKVEMNHLKQLSDPETKLSLNKLFCRPRVLHFDKSQVDIFDSVTRNLKILLGREGYPYAQKIIDGYIKVFAYSALCTMVLNENYDNGENDIVDSFITLVKANYRENRRVSFYATKLGITPNYLSTITGRITGRRPSDWIDDYVINEIKDRLSMSDQSIQDISYDLGFATPSHMTKFFHDRTGFTPREFRRSYRSNSSLRIFKSNME